MRLGAIAKTLMTCHVANQRRFFTYVFSALVFCLLAVSLLAADTAEPPPWKVNKPIVTVKKELFYKHPRPLAAATGYDEYIGPKLERKETRALEVADDVSGESTAKFSTDNGRTWADFQAVEDHSPELKGLGGGPTVYDPNSGVLVGMFMRQYSLGTTWNNFTYYRYSRDFGRTWTKPKQLTYEPGEEFDQKNPLKPGFLQKNQAYRGCNIEICRNGTLVHCVAFANAPNDPNNDKQTWRMGSLCFVGKWDPKAEDYNWKAGKRVEISPDVSSRGLMEPEVAELKDGRLLVVWRGSDTPKTPGRKWFSISKDGGLTLTDPAEWKYDDGSQFYSPSAWHRMLRHSVSGKLYWFGNICPEPPEGNWPRYPLIIAEVDEKTAALKRSTVTAIDDRKPGQSNRLQFSNFSLLENRETHELEMLLTIYSEDPSDWRNADCYKYTLTLK